MKSILFALSMTVLMASLSFAKEITNDGGLGKAGHDCRPLLKVKTMSDILPNGEISQVSCDAVVARDPQYKVQINSEGKVAGAPPVYEIHMTTDNAANVESCQKVSKYKLQTVCFHQTRSHSQTVWDVKLPSELASTKSIGE